MNPIFLSINGVVLLVLEISTEFPIHHISAEYPEIASDIY